MGLGLLRRQGLSDLRRAPSRPGELDAPREGCCGITPLRRSCRIIQLVTDAGMDSIGTGEDAASPVERVRALNETGDSRAYWNSEVSRV